MASEPQARALLQHWLSPYFQGGMLRYYVGNLTPKLAAALFAARQPSEGTPNETADAAGTDIAPAGAVPPLRSTVCAGDVVVPSLPGAAGDHPQTPSTLAAIPPEVQARAQALARAVAINVHASQSCDCTILNGRTCLFCRVRNRLAEALAAERQQQRAEIFKIAHELLMVRALGGFTAVGLVDALEKRVAALDAAVPGAREVNDG